MKNEIHTLQDLGISLANIRDSKDLSQKELSEQTGLDQKVISSLENGNPDIPLQSLLNVLGALEVSFALEQQTENKAAHGITSDIPITPTLLNEYSQRN